MAMSRLDELIKELCPNGVEYKELKDSTVMTRGTSMTKAQSIEGIYPVISGGKEPAFYCNQFNREGETITIAGSGAGAGYVQFWNVPIFVNDAFSVIAHEGNSTKYIYYCLTNLQEQIYGTKKGGGVPHVHISDIEKFIIPVPPLPVQEEIVRILDTFTSLTAELQAELQARKKQYEHYRNRLLHFGHETPIMILGEIGPVCMCKRILKSQTNSESGVPFFKIGTFGKEPNAYISWETFEEYKQKYNFPKKGDILISAAGTIGRTVVYNGEAAYFQDSNIVWIDNDETKVLNAFLIYCYAMKPWKISEGGTIPRLYNDNILNAVIPVPTLEQQRIIIDTLARFDAICNDITVGLPAEIEARQKQYEYYRNKLLTFKELS